MTTIVVRNEADARRALELLNMIPPGETVDVRFQGWPTLNIKSTERIRGAKSAALVMALQRAVERQFAAIKYRGNRRALTAPDRAEIDLDVRHSADGTRLSIDMSGAANAAARAVKRAAETGTPEAANLQTLFDLAGAAKEAASVLSKGVVDWGVRIIDRGSDRDIRHWGFATIIVAGLAFTATSLGPALIDAIAPSKDAPQIAGLENTTVVAKGDFKPNLTQHVQTALNAQSAIERDQARILSADEITDPLMKFVVAEAEGTRPALLELASMSGNIDINGLELAGKSAHAGAKIIRRAQKARRDSIGAWTTITRRAISS
jgi:hypothetical protein